MHGVSTDDPAAELPAYSFSGNPSFPSDQASFDRYINLVKSKDPKNAYNIEAAVPSDLESSYLKNTPQPIPGPQTLGRQIIGGSGGKNSSTKKEKDVPQAQLVDVPSDTPLADAGGKAQLVDVPSDTPIKSDEDLERSVAHPALVKAGLADKPSLADRFRYYVGSKIANFLPAAGGTIGGMAATPETVGTGTIPGAMAGAGLGSTVAEELKNELPQLFGSRASSIPQLLGNIGSDTVMQGALPEAIGQGVSAGLKPTLAKILASKFVSSTSPAVRAGVDYTSRVADAGAAVENAKNAEQTASQGLARIGQQTANKVADTAQFRSNPVDIIERGAQKVPDLPPEPIPDPFEQNLPKQPKMAAEPKNDIEEQLRVIKNTPPGGIQQVQLNKLHKAIISDPASFRNYILATGDKAGAEQLAVNDVVKQGFGEGSNTLNPDKILDALKADKNNIYGEGISGATKKNLTNFLTEAKNLQGASATAGDLLDEATRQRNLSSKLLEDTTKKVPDTGKLLSWRNGKLLLAGPVAAGIGGRGAGAVAGAVSGGIVLKEAALAALMKDPTIAKLTTQALKVGTSAPEATALSKVLMGAMRGSDVLYKSASDDDNRLEPATIDQNGQLQYAKPRTR